MSRQSLGLSLGHRRLRFSFQINDFKDREPPERPHRLAPGDGGGGDVVASVFRVKLIFVEDRLFRGAARRQRRRVFNRLIFCVKSFFLKRTFSLQRHSEVAGGGYLVKAASCVNRAFQPFCGSLKLRFIRPQKTVQGSGGASLRSFGRFDWSAETMVGRFEKQEIFQSLVPQGPGRLRLETPWGPPVSERGVDIRIDLRRCKRLVEESSRI
ncbi:hypothetical protein [Brevundimonas sp.]|uniref:hypothetical protein n=1 Tax=Brevundimonas sp. TaxID=1871086 RepID=UPI00391D0753